jgi:hypothetical protein
VVDCKVKLVALLVGQVRMTFTPAGLMVNCLQIRQVPAVDKLDGAPVFHPWRVVGTMGLCSEYELTIPQGSSRLLQRLQRSETDSEKPLF